MVSIFPCALGASFPDCLPPLDFKLQPQMWTQQPYRDCFTISHNCVSQFPMTDIDKRSTGEMRKSIQGRGNSMNKNMEGERGTVGLM